jgi:hypothetical protein
MQGAACWGLPGARLQRGPRGREAHARQLARVRGHQRAGRRGHARGLAAPCAPARRWACCAQRQCAGGGLSVLAVHPQACTQRQAVSGMSPCPDTGAACARASRLRSQTLSQHGHKQAWACKLLEDKMQWVAVAPVSASVVTPSASRANALSTRRSAASAATRAASAAAAASAATRAAAGAGTAIGAPGCPGGGALSANATAGRTGEESGAAPAAVMGARRPGAPSPGPLALAGAWPGADGLAHGAASPVPACSPRAAA